jgi:hypothetical protein
VIRWNNAVLEGIREAHPGPPMVARMLHVVHTCIYDAWAAYDENARGTQLGNTLRQPRHRRTAAHKRQAISYAAYRASVDLFPAQKPIFDALMSDLGYDPAYTATETHTPAGIGNTACAAVLADRHADGSNQLGDLHPGAYTDYSGYAPVNTPTSIVDPNRWQPLTVSNGHGGLVTQTSIAPFWGQVKPWALRSIAQYPVKPPAAAGTAAYRLQSDQVLNYSASLTDRQKVIAEYWADGPSSELPPGHWNVFAQFVSRRDHHRLDRDVKMFFAVNNALMDASVWTWGVKRAYDYIRPVSAVHYLFGSSTVTAWAGPGLGTQTIPGSAWRPYQAATVVTPPFSEYVSGHSTFSAAAAATLRLFTRSDAFGDSVTIAAGSSRVEPGAVPAADVRLRWPTFSAAADEAGISRRFGGIHFIDGDLEGRRVGKLIGAAAFEKTRSYFGRPHDDDHDHGHGNDD